MANLIRSHDFFNFMLQFPLGMAIAVNIRVGNELGAGNEVAAKRSSYVAVGMQSESVRCRYLLYKKIVTFLCSNFCCDSVLINYSTTVLHRLDLYIR